MEISSSVHFVRVRTDGGNYRVYAAACDRKDALNEVLKLVPAGSSASLLSEHLTVGQIAALNLRPGEVRDITR
jgi:hypothetical protein